MFLFQLVKSMRPKQWYKNFVIYAGLVFSLNLFNFDKILITSLGFILFCMISGSVYVINDIIDCEKDKKHPRKKKRPIASGKLNKKIALFSSILILILSFFIAYTYINVNFFLVGLTYLILIVTYSLFLLFFVFIDILILGVGFVLRALAGTTAIDVPMSEWLFLTIFVLALFLAAIKRVAEFNSMGKKTKEHRSVFEVYDQNTLGFLISTISSTVIICYSMYVILENTNILFMLTIPFVIFGIFRAYYLAYSKKMENAELFFRVLNVP